MSTQTMLTVNGIEVIYNYVILVLKGVSLEVKEGGIVALLGANGAGKTTTLKAISNLLAAERGAVTKGSIEFRGTRVDSLTPAELVSRGVVQVMEGRHCFPHPHRRREPADGRVHAQGVARRAQPRSRSRVRLLSAVEGAPRLAGRLHLGGRAADDGDRPRADGEPSMILLDEPSMGLAPAARRGDLRDREEPQPAGEGDAAARRAERLDGSALRRLTAISWRTAAW
jgi:branched-chain amino acid transport system ATP-binding protein